MLASAVLLSVAQNNNTIIPPEPIEESEFSFGVKGGFGHSFITPYSNYRFMPSWNAGISAVYSPFVHWGYGIDVIYSEEGAKFEDGEQTLETSLKYIRIPVKAIYFFRPYEADFRPKLALAPTVGFLTNHSDQPDYNTFDFGFSGTLGFNYRLVRAIWLSVDATWYQGLIDQYDYNNIKDFNGNARLDLGLHFGF